MNPDVKDRWNNLHDTSNKEPNKQKKKNALINAVVPRDKTAKVGGTVITGMTVQIQKTIASLTTKYDETWSEGQPVVVLKAQLGKELYQEGLDAGEIEEKLVNGKRMAYFMKDCLTDTQESILLISSLLVLSVLWLVILFFAS